MNQDRILAAQALGASRWQTVRHLVVPSVLPELFSGLRLAALERGVVIAARDLGKLKTWSQAMAAAAGGVAAGGAWSHSVSWWLLLLAVTLTWVSGFDYARSAPSVLRGRAVPSA